MFMGDTDYPAEADEGCQYEGNKNGERGKDGDPEGAQPREEEKRFQREKIRKFRAFSAIPLPEEAQEYEVAKVGRDEREEEVCTDEAGGGFNQKPNNSSGEKEPEMVSEEKEVPRVGENRTEPG